VLTQIKTPPKSHNTDFVDQPKCSQFGRTIFPNPLKRELDFHFLQLKVHSSAYT
jgi:hypothetical protein